MSTIRKRSLSNSPLASTSNSLPSTIPLPARLRPRAYSVHPSSIKTPSSPLGYSSSYSNSSNYNRKNSLSSLCDYVRVKLEEVEEDIRTLKGFVEESESEDFAFNSSSSSGSASASGSGSSSNSSSDGVTEEEVDDDEWEVVTRGKGKAKAKLVKSATTTAKDSKKRNIRAESMSSSSSSNESSTSTSASSSTSSAKTYEDISTLEQFIQTASKFLSSVKSELSNVTQPFNNTSDGSSSSFVQFQLSTDARIALDSFLLQHPLPTFSQLDLRTRLDDSKKSASNSAAALFSRVASELVGLQQVLSHLANLESNTAFVASCIPSLPSISSISTSNSTASTPNTTAPSSPTSQSTPFPVEPLPLQGLRDYFSTESDRLSSTLKKLSSSGPVTSLIQLGTDTTNSIVNEASELTSLLTANTSAAFDEATRIYHAALEGGRKRLLRYEELPFEWRNNEHIYSGYRYIAIDRWYALLRSAFEIHNETINIQSHFVGFLSLCYLLIWRLPNSPHTSLNSHWCDTAIALLFLGAAMKCLLCSTAWHLLAGCATRHIHAGAACVDYVGISALIAASVIGMEYYGFYCRPDLAAAYMTFSAILGISGMILPWKPWFNERRFKMWRIGFFLGLAVSATMPMFHACFLYGFSKTLAFFAPALPSILAYLIGLTCYALQWPECGGSGRYDLIFASHQLWHCAIVAAIWLHWRSLDIWATIAVTKSAGMLSCLA